jgi:predicted CxxxxCH...CXXCH cytochrome family protein
MNNGGIWSLNLTNSAYDTASKTCSNIPCHLTESYGTEFPALKWGRTPVGWSTCNNCHRF